MSLSYEKLCKRPLIFLRLTVLKLEEFEVIYEKLKPSWEAEIENKRKAVGRPSCLKTLEDKFLAFLMYYRT